MSETLGQRLKRKLQLAVNLGYITQERADKWVTSPPKNQADADHLRFILELVKE